MTATVYYPGGYEPTAPKGNVAESWDDATRTYTHWAVDGTVISTRPYTADENGQADVAASFQAAQAKVETATTNLQGLYANRGALQAAIGNDVTTITNHAAELTTAGSWDALTAAQRTQIAHDVLDILGRVLQTGLADAMTAHIDHLIVAGVVQP